MPDRIQRARVFVQNLFQELDADEEPYSETILIREGQYCGHRFSRGSISAVWFCEEDEVKLYDEKRRLLQVDTLRESPTRRAA